MVAASDFQLQVCYIMIMGEKGPMFYYPITINTYLGCTSNVECGMGRQCVNGRCIINGGLL